ncbi:hypothetical protein [Novipirellula galeiformis]|nr:hypothetical protein [Novipirellula galeiformis]
MDSSDAVHCRSTGPAGQRASGQGKPTLCRDGNGPRPTIQPICIMSSEPNLRHAASRLTWPGGNKQPPKGTAKH